MFVLYDMALQAMELGRPEEALRLIHLGHAATSGSHSVSAGTITCLATIQARAHAAQGDAAACDRALGQSVEHFGTIDATCDSMADFLNEAHLASMQGGAHYELALANRDSQVAARTVSLLLQAVDAVTALHSPRLTTGCTS